MVLLCTFVLSAAVMSTPGVGDIAPDFSVTDTDGVTWNLDKMVERGPVLVAFFPKAFTGG